MTALWRARGFTALVLLPLGLLFFLLSQLRRAAYRWGLLKTIRLRVPVVVVGNIIAGGAGKTPLTLWLATRLAACGSKPGIVSRGYGRDTDDIREVKVGADGTAPGLVGDEPLLLARRSGCPVFVGNDRAAAASALLSAHPDCNLIICDDGLQHYRLARNFEIAVLDRRGLMNGWPLPAGPLREPASRLREVDALVLNDTDAPVADTAVPVFSMRLRGERFYRLGDPGTSCGASDLSGIKLCAMAGIGEPQRFFDHLAAMGLQCETRAFPDHHRYTSSDFKHPAEAFLLTEKDALKCAGLTTLPIWVLPVEARIEPDLARFVLNILEKTNGPAPA